MAQINYSEQIPNNVDLDSDRRLKRALDQWHPRFLDWWNESGPQVFKNNDVYLRTAISTAPGGWANFGYVRMPDYRWGIFLADAEKDRVIPAGDDAGQKVWHEVPGEHRHALRRLIVIQADTEPASVEQQRWLAKTAPSLYDCRNLFQVNVEEARHLWAMVYLLHGYFGRDGRDEADELLIRQSGHADTPRLLDAFNQPCDDWLSFFCFTAFTDRDGKYQLGALAESAFDPLSRSCRFMLTEEAHHLFVGESGLSRIVQRSVELMKQDPNGDVAAQGGIPLEIIQRFINYWFSYCLDLFGAEVSSNAADSFAAGLKGRWAEAKQYEEHSLLHDSMTIVEVEDNELVDRVYPMRNAMNEVLRAEYAQDCAKVVERINRVFEKGGVAQRLTLPHKRFHRHQGVYKDHHFDPMGELTQR
jgi:benzoyl-CoA 2,3-dioxygenase component B